MARPQTHDDESIVQRIQEMYLRDGSVPTVDAVCAELGGSRSRNGAQLRRFKRQLCSFEEAKTQAPQGLFRMAEYFALGFYLDWEQQHAATAEALEESERLRRLEEAVARAQQDATALTQQLETARNELAAAIQAQHRAEAQADELRRLLDSRLGGHRAA
ncbi:MAG: hypothetical protein CMH65_07920 [Nevskiales bacterium]|nr:hypothetical protein [Nevskiales bacterium]